jgi:hypothetical protein
MLLDPVETSPARAVSPMIHRGFMRIKSHRPTSCRVAVQKAGLPRQPLDPAVVRRSASGGRENLDSNAHRRSPAETRKFETPNVRDSDSRIRYIDSNPVEKGFFPLWIPILRHQVFGIPILRTSRFGIHDVGNTSRDSCESTKNSGFRMRLNPENRRRRIPGGVEGPKFGIPNGGDRKNRNNESFRGKIC